MTPDGILGLYNYWVVICLMMTGFYIVIARKNLIKTVIGLNIFQTSVVLLYITMGKVIGGTAPVIPPTVATEHAAHDTGLPSAGHGDDGLLLEPVADGLGHAVDHGGELIYSNPLPSVLMLTAIVVGIATTALALALIVRISEDYGTIEEDEIQLIDRQDKTNP
jgi:multicomponent Na+:H+ antiporter subunit C